MSKANHLQVTTYRNRPVEVECEHEAEQYFKDHACRILLVEDDPVTQKITEFFLIDMGCKVDIASNGEQALAANLDNYHGMVLDIGLPGIDGLEVTRQIRLSQKSFAQLPIVALTAHMQKHQENECKAKGINEFLVKPTTTRELCSKLFLAITAAHK